MASLAVPKTDSNASASAEDSSSSGPKMSEEESRQEKTHYNQGACVSLLLHTSSHYYFVGARWPVIASMRHYYRFFRHTVLDRMHRHHMQVSTSFHTFHHINDSRTAATQGGGFLVWSITLWVLVTADEGASGHAPRRWRWHLEEARQVRPFAVVISVHLTPLLVLQIRGSLIPQPSVLRRCVDALGGEAEVQASG